MVKNVIPELRGSTPIAILVLMGALLFLFLSSQNQQNQNAGRPGEKMLGTYATKALAKCAKANSRQRCYDDELLKLLDFISMEDIFKVTELVQQKDDAYWFCHPLSHNLSAKEYHKDRAKWRELMLRCPIGQCANGCLHGVLQEHFKAAALSSSQLGGVLPDLDDICERRSNWNPTQLEQSSCYHELGHLSLYLTGGEPRESVKVCDQVAVKDDGRNFLESCYEGLFMQVFEPREREDFALIYHLIPIKENLKECETLTQGIQKGACWEKGWGDKAFDFCNQYSGEVRGACFREAWVVAKEKIQTVEGIMSYCSYSDDLEERKRCYGKIYYGLMALNEFDDTKVKPICIALPQELKGHCFTRIAARLIETDKKLIDRALSLCGFADTLGVAEECYQYLAQAATTVFQSNSEESRHLCDSLPQVWQPRCSKPNNAPAVQ